MDIRRGRRIVSRNAGLSIVIPAVLAEEATEVLLEAGYVISETVCLPCPDVGLFAFALDDCVGRSAITLCHNSEIFFGSVAGIRGFFSMLEWLEGSLWISSAHSKNGGKEDGLVDVGID